MHEFALAQNIVETIEEKVSADLAKIVGIDLEVGAFSGVVVESLCFGLEAIFSERDVSGVKVNISRVPTVARCECGYEYELKDIFETCPGCQGFARQLISGMDVILKSVELAADADAEAVNR